MKHVLARIFHELSDNGAVVARKGKTRERSCGTVQEMVNLAG